MPSRPRLRPSFRPVRRGNGTVQLGLTPETGGVLLVGLDPSEVGLLERLDGSLTEPDVYALAAGWGVPRRRADELLQLLWDRGLLVDRPERPERAGAHGMSRQHVVVAGSGPVAVAIAAVLRDGAIGRVSTGGWATDLAEAELRAALSPWRPLAVDRGPQLVVSVAGPGGLDVRAGQAWRSLGVPVLPVTADGDRVLVGPLVRPSASRFNGAPDGPDRHEPCLSCLDLARADGEAGWPGTGPVAYPREHPPAALAAVAAGAVGMVVHAVLGGEPVPSGVSIETSLPWPRFDHRRWERHPACSAHTEPVPSSGTLG